MLPTDLHSKIISESSINISKENSTQPMTNKNNDDSFSLYLENIKEFGTQIIEEEKISNFNINSAKNIISDYYIITKILKNTSSEKRFIAQTFIDIEDLNKKRQINILNEVIEVCLKGLWAQNEINIHNKIFINAKIDKDEKCYLINSNNIKNNSNPIEIFLQSYIIIEPEIILSPSQIKLGFDCIRHSLIVEEFKSISNDDISIFTIVGKIIHEFFENTISNLFSNNIPINGDFIKTNLEKIIKNYYFEISLINKTYEEIHKESFSFIENIYHFYKTYFEDGSFLKNGVKILKYINSEKKIMSPSLGIGGYLDILVEFINNEEKQYFGPLELKTGKYHYITDQLQVYFYCLMLSKEIYQNCTNGVLIYLKDGSYEVINIKPLELINAIVLRNVIANKIKYFENIQYENNNDSNDNNKNNNNNDNNKLLPDIKDLESKTCQKCFKYKICKSHYYLIENINNDVFPNEMKYYFQEFYKIINKEENFYIKNKRKYNIENFKFNEKNIFKCSNIEDKGTSFQITLNYIGTSNFSFSFLKDIKEEYYIFFKDININVRGITINKTDNSILIEIPKYRIDIKNRNLIENYTNKLVLIKKAETLTKVNFKFMRGNLITFLLNPNKSKIIENLQSRILYNKYPQFYGNTTEYYKKVLNTIRENFDEEFRNLNENQQFAIFKSILSTDYMLIHGFPGSGKTTFITLLTRILYSLNKKILIVSHTNTAVDNILLKLKKTKTPFCRITNNYEIIHNELKENILNIHKYNSVKEWDDFLSKNLIFATTLFGISHKFFSYHTFDYCIVDEACQAFEIELLGALLISNIFILVGDPNQLSAMLLSIPPQKQPQLLFLRLLKGKFIDNNNEHDNVYIKLNLQYRMNEKIMQISNECMYDNCMKCANQNVANRFLKIDNFESLINVKKWIKDILNPEKPVLFIDYNIILKDSNFLNNNNESDKNDIEINIIFQIISVLNDLKFNMNEIGIITPYKTQENALREKLNKLINPNNIYTIDKSQGIEKEIIFVSFVKTNEKTKLLTDNARINVAFTRPRSKLILIGITNVLINIPTIKDYINILIRDNLIYNLSNI